MTNNSGRVTGSREPSSPSCTASLRPSGFDPARIVAAWKRYGDIPPDDFVRHYVAEAICDACTRVAYPEASPFVVESLREAFAVKCLPEAEAAIAAVREIDAGWVAIAAEARRAKTPQDGSVHEGAAIAQTQPPSGSRA